MQLEMINSTAGLMTKPIHIGRQANIADVIPRRETGPEEAEYEVNMERGALTGPGRDLARAFADFSEYTGWGNFNIDFSQDDETKTWVIKIIDRVSGETIRQIPPEQALNLRQHLREVIGLVFDHLA